MKQVIFLLMVIFLIGSVSAISWSGGTTNIINQTIGGEGGGNVTHLNNLTDVNVPNPNDQDVLTWDDGSSLWIAQSLGALSKWIIDTTNGFFYTNDTDLFFNETHLNQTLSDYGIKAGFNDTYNSTYDNYAFNVSLNHTEITFDLYNSTWDNQGIIAGLNLSVIEKLNITDERYNETDLLESINTTDNIDELGFLNKSGTNANQNINIVASNWFKGLFDWVINAGISQDYLTFNGSALTFDETTLNATIDDKLTSIYHNASQSSAVAGIVDGGDLIKTQHPDANYDGDTFNFSEASGSPGLDLRINFTNVSDFSRGIIRYKTSSLAGDFPVIQMWSYEDNDWEDYPLIAESESFATVTQPVFDDDEHIQNGMAQMRIYKSSNGNTNNHYYVDWIAIVEGPGVPSGQEIDPFFEQWLNNATFESNLRVDDYNVTANWFFGLFDWFIDINL